MKVPAWVLEEIDKLPADYRGQIRLNCNEGVSNIDWDTPKRYPPEGWRQRDAATTS